VYCQLEALQDCLPPSVRRTLDELPESLDETYERILKEIKKPNRDHARRLFQCLVVAIRPLSVKELAEVLAVDFDNAEGIPKLKTNWRWEDQELAIFTSCSSLITIVGTGRSRVVQFSHFSVKEYLTSARLAISSEDVSRYHIILQPAHTTLAQACMGVFLRRDYRVEQNDAVEESSPLAGYATRHWVTHAQFESVSSSLRKAMEYLFDEDKPYFATWLQLHNMDTPWMSPSLYSFAVRETDSLGTPLYYAALCGFQDVVEHLVVKNPQHVNASGGLFVTPLGAALAGRHFQTVKLLHHRGAHVDVHSTYGLTPLFSVARHGDIELVQVLLECKADVNARDSGYLTPIHFLSLGSGVKLAHNIRQSASDTVRLLLEHGADLDARTNHGSTPLHFAANSGMLETVRVLLEHGANVGAKDNEGRTPLHRAVDRWFPNPEVVRVLLEHGAIVDAEDNDGRTPFQIAKEGRVEIMELMSEHGARGGS
jgi:ankyrin repeat protein